MSRSILLFVVAALVAPFALAGCAKEEPAEKLPPASLQPDASKPAASDNPGGASPASAK